MSNVRVQNIQGQLFTEREELSVNQNGNKGDSLVIGSSECRFSDLVVAIHDGGYSEISGKWKHVGLSLGLRQLTLDTLHSRLKASRVSILDIYKRILVEWRSNEGENATLMKLIKVLEEHKLQKASNALKEKFGIADQERNKYITVLLGSLAFLFFLLLLSQSNES